MEPCHLLCFFQDQPNNFYIRIALLVLYCIHTQYCFMCLMSALITLKVKYIVVSKF